MERFVDLSLADVGRTVYRYRPVVAAAAAIAVLGLLLPSPRQIGQDLAQFASGSPSTPPTQSPPGLLGDVAPEIAGDGALGAADGSAVFTSPSAFDSAAGSTFSGNDASSSFGSDTSGPSTSSSSSQSSTPSGGSSSSAGSSSSPAATPPDTVTSSAPARAEIVTTLYASRTAGTPLAAQGVPAKSLPVGNRGQEDKVSFLRLSKPIDTLVLKPVTEGDRNPTTAAIQVCSIKTAGWSAGEAVAFSAAPERDCTVSVRGVRAGDGTWSFDLRPFEGRPGDGFALSPAPGSPVDFQVAFEAKLP